MLRLTSERQSGRWAAMRDERAAIKAVIEQSFGSHVDQFTSDFQNIVQNFVMILILIKIQNLCVIVEHYLGMEPFAMFINVDEVEVVRSVNRPKFTTHFNLCFQNIPIFVLQIDDTLIIAN